MATIKWRENLEYNLNKDYSLKKVQFDWSDWLAEIGADSMSSVNFIATSGELVVTNPTNDATTCECEVAADPSAVVGDQYKLMCVIDTAGGQSEPRSIYFNIIDS